MMFLPFIKSTKPSPHVTPNPRLHPLVPQLDLACYVARAFHVQQAIATCPIFSPFFSYSSSDFSTPVWTTSHAKIMFASPASLLWVDPFTVPINILHDVSYTLHNPTPSRYVLRIDASLDEYTSCVTDFLRMNPSFGYFVGPASNAHPWTGERHGVTMRDRRRVLCFFPPNTQAETADCIHYHDVMRTLGKSPQLSGRDKLPPPPKGLFLRTFGRFLQSEWWSVWNSEMKSRSVMYNTRPCRGTRLGCPSNE